MWLGENARQSREPRVAEHLVLSAKHFRRRRARHLPAGLVGLGQQTDVGGQIDTREVAAAVAGPQVHNAARVAVPADEPPDPRQRQAGELRQVAADRPLVRTVEARVSEPTSTCGWAPRACPCSAGVSWARPSCCMGARGGGLQTLGWRMAPLGTGRAAMDASMAFKLMRRRAGIFGENDHGISLEARLNF